MKLQLPPRHLLDALSSNLKLRGFCWALGVKRCSQRPTSMKQSAVFRGRLHLRRSSGPKMSSDERRALDEDGDPLLSVAGPTL